MHGKTHGIVLQKKAQRAQHAFARFLFVFASPPPTPQSYISNSRRAANIYTTYKYIHIFNQRLNQRAFASSSSKTKLFSCVDFPCPCLYNQSPKDTTKDEEKERLRRRMQRL
jgi:hypothetical protein